MVGTRREFLRTVGTSTTLGAAALVATAGAASAKPDNEHYDQQPDDVELVYDEDLLERYRPLLLVGHLDIQPSALHAWVARDTGDTDRSEVLVYWAEYARQEGVSPAQQGPFSDSHFGDHEPIYVFRDPGDESVTKVLYTGYHWLKATSRAPPLYQDEQAQFHVFKPWHHYRLAEDAGQDVDLADLTDSFPSWLENGLEEDLRPGAVTNPWSMERHSSWWREGSFGLNTSEFFAELWLSAGFDRAGETDLD